MKAFPEHIEPCHYDYANKCDCSEDDKCGCDYPNNIPHDYSIECLTAKETDEVATDAPMTASAFDHTDNPAASERAKQKVLDS